ncbi:unnamed protein product, partial [Staurois parvus]
MVRQSQGSEQGQQRVRHEQGAGTGYRAQEKHTPRQSLQVWPSLKYTSIISSKCLTGCKVESLIAGSTRWPALVLQLIKASYHCLFTLVMGCNRT